MRIRSRRPGMSSRPMFLCKSVYRAPVAASPRFGVLEQLLGFHLRRAQLAVFEDYFRDAPEPILTPGQLAILVVAQDNPSLMQRELCQMLGIDKSTFALALHRLANRGLLRRVRSGVDRRQNFLRLTAKGHTVLEANVAHVRRHERRFFANLAPHEREELARLLHQIGAS